MLLFWSGYLIVGTIIYLIVMNRFENDSEFQNTIYSDLVKMHANKIMLMIIIGWFPLLILSIMDNLFKNV